KLTAMSNYNIKKTMLVVGGLTLVGAIAIPATLTVVGFTSAGIGAGTAAAYIQGPAIAKGSFFALTQSAAAKGLLLAAGSKIGFAAGVGAQALSTSYNYARGYFNAN
uniref:hypothetical protein n=1 Tax=Salmonella sp. s51228 TaxID=3159652 RepID=UPI00398030B6